MGNRGPAGLCRGALTARIVLPDSACSAPGAASRCCAFDEIVELGLLLKEVVTGRLGGFQLQGQMHAFMAAVLLRVARFDALDLDTEPEPPDGELGEVEEGIRTGEGNAVIGADGFGQAELLENGLEHAEGVG